MEMHQKLISSSAMNPQQSIKEEEEEEEEDQEMELIRRGPWTVEEDLALINYVAEHGEGRWNSLARSAGLKRTGKSCRLRWLNYLRPDVRRGNITLEEQLLILELHSRWGNRWSKIAQQLPGRTDNEIKNYWRTRVQKQAKQLQCDVNSKKFRDMIRCLWMPRLLERIHHSSSSTHSTASTRSSLDFSRASMPTTTTTTDQNMKQQQLLQTDEEQQKDSSSSSDSDYFKENSHSGAPQAGFAGWTDDHEPFAQVYDDRQYCSSTANLQIKDELLGGDLSESFWSFEDIWSMQ